MSAKDKEALNLEKFQEAYVHILNELKAFNDSISSTDVAKNIDVKLALENQLRTLQDDFIRLSEESSNTGLSPKEWESYSRTLDEVITQIKDKIGSTIPKFEEEIGQEDNQLIDDPNAIFDEILMDLERNEHQDNLESGDTQIYEQKASSEPAKKDSQIEQDIEDILVAFEKSSDKTQKSFVEDIEHQVSEHQSIQSGLVSDVMDTFAFGTPIKNLYKDARAAIREKNINAIENIELRVSQLQGQLERAKNDNASKLPQSPLRKVVVSVLEIAITELTKIKDSLLEARKELTRQPPAIETMKAIKGMLEGGQNLDSLSKRRDPNSPHQELLADFHSIEAKIAAGVNPAEFLDKLNKMKAQLEKAEPKIIIGSRRSAAETTIPSVSAKAPAIPPRPANRAVESASSVGARAPALPPRRPGNTATTSAMDITIDLDKISAGIDALINSRGFSSRSVQPLKAVADYNSLRADIASSKTVQPEMQMRLVENRKILTQAMGFGNQVERVEKLANDSKLLSSPANAQKLLAAVTKLSEKLESEVQKLENKQKNPRMNAAVDVIAVTLDKLYQVKSKVVQKLPAEQRVKEETRHFKQ